MELALKGKQGKTVYVSGDAVRIEKRSILTGSRDKTILIRNITSVEVKKPTGFFAGFIQFSIAGGKARDSSFTLSGGSFDAAQDENSVLFQSPEDYENALRIKDFVESWTSGKTENSPQQPTAATTAEEIRQLKALQEEGLITADEFEQKKKQLLGL